MIKLDINPTSDLLSADSLDADPARKISFSNKQLLEKLLATGLNIGNPEITVDFADIANIMAVDRTIAFAADFPPEVGSYFIAQNNRWYPLKNEVNYYLSTEKVETAIAENSFFDIEFIEGIFNTNPLSTFIAGIGISAAQESTFDISMVLDGKSYLTNQDTSQSFTFTIPAGDVFLPIDLILNAVHVSGNYRIFISKLGLTNICPIYPWAINLLTPAVMPQGLKVTLYYAIFKFVLKDFIIMNS